jgi:hypothetical protein
VAAVAVHPESARYDRQAEWFAASESG